MRASHEPVVIFANGHGSRISSVSQGSPKTMLHVGQRPMLAWLLDEIAQTDPPRSTTIYLQRRNDEVDELVTNAATDVRVVYAQPRGYLRDLQNVARELGSAFSIVDADLVAPPGTLRTYLRLASQLGGQADLCVGFTECTGAGDDRTTWLSLDRDGFVRTFGRDIEPTGLCTVGAFRWGAGSLDGAAEFLSRSRSLMAYVSELIHRGGRVLPLPMLGALNVNVPAELTAARRAHERWCRGPGVDQPRLSRPRHAVAGSVRLPSGA